MNQITEEEKVACLIDFFGWDDSTESQFHALKILRDARGEPAPLWDDYRAGIRR